MKNGIEYRSTPDRLRTRCYQGGADERRRSVLRMQSGEGFVRRARRLTRLDLYSPPVYRASKSPTLTTNAPSAGSIATHSPSGVYSSSPGAPDVARSVMKPKSEHQW